MADAYTEAEIQRTREWFASPEGRSRLRSLAVPSDARWLATVDDLRRRLGEANKHRAKVERIAIDAKMRATKAEAERDRLAGLLQALSDNAAQFDEIMKKHLEEDDDHEAFAVARCPLEFERTAIWERINATLKGADDESWCD